MMIPLRTLFTCLIVLAFLYTDAQPRKHDLAFGCHILPEGMEIPAYLGPELGSDCGSNARSDSIDVLNYAVDLDLTQFGSKIVGACEVTITPKEDGIEFLPLDLLNLTVDSVKWGDTPLNFTYDDLLLDIALPVPLNIGDTTSVTVYYQGLPTPDASGFGGFVFDQGIGYNLGIGLDPNSPFNFGKSWHPCFDNFMERATYDISITTNGGRTGYAIGEFLEEEDLGGDVIRRSFRMNLPLPTYLVGVAASNYVEHHDIHSGAYGDHPILLVGKPAEEQDMIDAFEYLGESIDALEAWFGPYIWGQVGYVMTTQGAMEHSTLIAYPNFSITTGPTYNMRRLMAHELAHHWWGNITTLSCPENMWIKEGNAEYGSHLFHEYSFGRDFFEQVVKANHYDVLQHAHRDDGGIYHPLSGIPNEYTYGTHTYNKGAVAMHNLRGYLGDTLFSKGMQSVLETYRFDAIDAEQMQNQLTEATGIDMSHFFNGWIYQPGFATYEIDSVQVTLAAQPGMWQAKIFVEQKLREALNYHTNVPLEVTFYSKDWETHHATIMVSGQFSEAVTTIPFEPVWQVLNDRQKLNLARMQDRTTVYGNGPVSLQRVELINDLEIFDLPDGDSAIINLTHHWVAPDEDPDLPIQMSSTHYWTLGGVIPAGTKAKCRFRYRGESEEFFDYDLVNQTEDSLILAWRPNAATPWAEYPFYLKQTVFGSDDGDGYIRIDEMLPGDYAFANGSLPLATAVEEVRTTVRTQIFPNPADDELNVQVLLPDAEALQLTIFDAVGRPVQQVASGYAGKEWLEKIDISQLPAGVYMLEVRSGANGVRTTEKFIVN